MIVSFLFLLSGCTPSGIHVVPAKGTVLYEGKAVDKALVMFVPVSGGRSAVGTTDNTGEFSVISPGAKRGGCVPGKYKIIVTKELYVDSKGNPIVFKDDPNNSTIPPHNHKLKSFLPKKFEDPTTSGLTAEVKPQGTNHFVFNLDDK